MIKKIFAVAQELFPNGVRADFIAVNKIKLAYFKKYGEEIPPKFDVLDVLDTKTFPYDGKVYFISAEARKRVVNFADKLLADNNLIVFYESLYQRHRETFNKLKIFSPKLVAAILKAAEENFFTEKFFGEKFFAINRYVTLKYVVEYILKSGVKMTLDDLQKILPYVPADELRKTLSDAKAFMPTTTGKFSLPKTLQVDEREIESARKKFFADIKNHGYAVLNVKLFPESFAANELSAKNFCNALYKDFFVNDFNLRGTLLTLKGKILTVKDLIRAFCAEHDELTAEKLFEHVNSIVDKKQSTFTALEVAHEIMTRVSKDLFVKDERVHFDIDGTDAALNNFVQGRVIPLRDVTSFATFPPVDSYTWNLYLLESFVRKFSRQFKFYTPATNNALVGAICPRERNFADYRELQAAVIVQENIPLYPVAVEDFLVGKGFRSMRKKKTTQDIINLAREMGSD